jgi:hypothetical protein
MARYVDDEYLLLGSLRVAAGAARPAGKPTQMMRT